MINSSSNDSDRKYKIRGREKESMLAIIKTNRRRLTKEIQTEQYALYAKISYKFVHGGLYDVKQHDKGEDHSKNIRLKQRSASIANYYGKPSTSP